MAVTRVSDNQIAQGTTAVITALSFLNTTSVLRLPSGNTDDQPEGVSVGTLRFNTDNDNAEIYVADADGQGNAGWTEVAGGGPSVGEDGVIRTNSDTISENLTVGPTANGDAKFTNGFSVGPIQIGTNFTVTVEADAVWSII
ncbi:hypothetical protein [Synechococcus phage S-M1]|uniref:Virion structural protein n=1 Tax=Synechococcus phage QB2 TaxID=3159453 RepID=A0AAU8EK91_9CAUD|nr:hypothetical protein [Synechococcus phage S-M1]